ncbi:MAG: flagellar hook-basal body complex protein [Planctomycetes bacterium]|nr:flagellar hook-basal body complex protein [Planctomycetota bacterium]
MRTATLSLLPLLFVACQSPMPAAPRSAAAAVEAALRGTVSAENAVADVPEAAVRAVDPEVAALLKATLRDYSVRRRVALENLANVHTTGYKRRVVAIAPRATLGSQGTPVPVPASADACPVFSNGALFVTERMLDLAIEGDGFFAVVLCDGSTGYTRDGRLHVDRGGKLTTTDGCVLLPEITVPGDALEISIDPSGRVSGRTAGSPDTSTGFGQLTLALFVNPEGLLPRFGRWLQTDNSGPPCTGAPGTIGLGMLKQGCLEGSNVQFGEEMIELQALERQYQVLTEVMQKFGLIAP